MVSARQRASKAAAAALGLAAGASLCSNHGVGAFYSPLTFAPRPIPGAARPAEGAHATPSFSAAGRGHRFYVRERAGSEVLRGMGSRQGGKVAVMGRARGLGEGSRQSSRLGMLAEEEATSVSVGAGHGLCDIPHSYTWGRLVVRGSAAVGPGPLAQDLVVSSCTSVPGARCRKQYESDRTLAPGCSIVGMHAALTECFVHGGCW